MPSTTWGGRWLFPAVLLCVLVGFLTYTAIVSTCGPHPVPSESFRLDSLRRGLAATEEEGQRSRAAYAAVLNKSDPSMRRMAAALDRVMSMRVLCWVMTGPTTIKEKGTAILETWGPKCDKLLFMTSEKDKTPLAGRVSLPGVGEGRDALVAKSEEAWKHVWTNYRDEYQWFYKCDDDTYTVVENLKWLAATLEPQHKPFFLGKHLREPFGDHLHWLSGGAGYVLNRLALDRLQGALEKKCMNDPNRPYEDQLVSRCLANAGVGIDNSLDGIGRSRFLPLSPELHLTPGAVAKTVYKWVLSQSDGKESETDGAGCCSELAIAFHYISPQSQHALHYLINTLHPFGSRISDLKLLPSS